MYQVSGFIKEVDVKKDLEKVKNELFNRFGIEELHILKQVHGDKIFIDSGGEGDGVIVTKPKSGALIRTADCFGVALIDRVKGISGVFHSGWRGTELNICGKGAGLMKTMGCFDIEATIFPGIESCCFEIGLELLPRFEKANIAVKERDNGYYGDLKKAISESLKGEGIENIKDLSECTFCNEEYFSFRRDKTEKRHGVFVVNCS
ncbi:MAG: polyphenol oxidase family protein [bacterium]